MHLFHIQTICTYFLFNLNKTLVCLYVQNVNTTCVLAFSHMLVRSCNLQSVGLILCASALDGLHVWSASPGAAFLSDSRRATTSLNSLWIAAFSLSSAEMLGFSELRWSGSASLWPETDLSREMLTNKDRTWELRAVLLHGIGFFLKTLLSSGGFVSEWTDTEVVCNFHKSQNKEAFSVSFSLFPSKFSFGDVQVTRRLG